jgi:hypothetical protein
VDDDDGRLSRAKAQLVEIGEDAQVGRRQGHAYV